MNRGICATLLINNKDMKLMKVSWGDIINYHCSDETQTQGSFQAFVTKYKRKTSVMQFVELQRVVY